MSLLVGNGNGVGNSKGKKSLFLGRFIHCKSLDQLEYLDNTAVAVDENGIIVAVGRDCGRERAEKTLFPGLGWRGEDVAVREAGTEEFFFPGFVDTHIHAPQYPNSGLFGKTTLLDWLNTYTFPTEASLTSLPKAQTVYEKVISRTLSNGTTTASYYATIDVAATNLLADLCLEKGQRAFIGRCCMDCLSPDWYCDSSAEKSILDTKKTIQHIEKIDPKNKLITPILTPRFAPGCSSKLMTDLGKLAKETGLPIQTHISENKNEIAMVAKLFPEYRSYTHVYDHHNLLTPRTTLAHAVHLSDEEIALVKERGAGVAHCPVSNMCITSGLCPVRKLLDQGVEVGLGTDVSGGFSASILEAGRMASLMSRCVAMNGEEKAKLSVEECLYLATRGGARVTGLGGKVGAFEVGLEWDAQLVGLGGLVDRESDGDGDRDGDGDGDGGRVDVFGWETWEERVAKWVFCGDDRNTRAVWVRGRLVHEK